MLQKTYSVYTGDYNNCTLFVEAGKKFIACWCKNNDTKKITGFELFHSNKALTDDLHTSITSIKQLSILIESGASQTNFIWNSPDALCIPADYYSDELAEDYSNIAFGNSAETVRYVQTYENIEVFAATDEKLHQTVDELFPNANVYHHHYCLLSSIPGTDQPALYVYFFPGSFTVIAFKHGRLQLIQTRHFTAAEEVLYFVLNVYREHHFTQHETAVYAAGFIDENSSLFQLLYQYIEGLQLQLPRNKLFASNAFDEYKPHVYLPFVHYNI